jgi:hypothetical protein
MKAKVVLGIAALLAGAVPARAQERPEGGPQIHVMAFGDVDYLATDRKAVQDGFQLGQFVGHVNAGLTDRLTAFAEFTVTPRDGAFNLVEERLILRYDFHDAFKLSAGRYHAPVSYWNTAFHHGSWLQPSVSRPEMIKFGTRFLPVHFVGVLAEGNLPGAPLGLGYSVGLGNGRQANIAVPGDAGDANRHPAFLGTLRARPAALYGLEIGGAGYAETVSPGTGPGIRERILSAHVAWERDAQLIAEYVHLRHEPMGAAAAPAATSRAGYVQAGYRLPGAAHAFTPYGRWEQLRVGDGDALLGALKLDYDAWIGGMRYDFAPFAALKAEYRSERFADPGRLNSFWLQAAFTVAPLGDHAM